MSEDNDQPAVLLPTQCQSMVDVRAGVDAVDKALVGLLARRFGYMDAAARIKDSRGAVRDEERKAEVIANVRAEAAAMGLPVVLLTKLWDDLVEGSIAYELDRWDQTRG